MFGKRITLFQLFGFAVRMDISWLIIALLFTWSLAVGFFPFRYKNLSTATYWWMGVAGTAGLFISIVFHELWHSLVARRYGLPIKGITLFIFGGVAEMDDEPPSAKAEFLMAIAGPISSILLALGFYGVFLFGQKNGLPDPVLGVTGYLGWINGLLAAFNLIPGFPLDGGRVLRSILWGIRGNLRWATRIASRIGWGFGTVLILLGIISVFRGGFISGLWWFLIGMFLQKAATMSYQQLLMRQALEGEPVRRFMKPNPVTVAPSLSVEQLVEDYIYKHHYKMFPVLEGGRLIGYVSTREAKGIPRGDWPRHTVRELVKPCSADNTIGPEDDALRALSKMSRKDISRLLVVDGDKLVGIIALKDMLAFLSLKVELEGKDGEKRQPSRDLPNS
jgi:Zn-dependent protease/CBS domain-containing protein